MPQNALGKFPIVFQRKQWYGWNGHNKKKHWCGLRHSENYWLGIYDGIVRHVCCHRWVQLIRMLLWTTGIKIMGGWEISWHLHGLSHGQWSRNRMQPPNNSLSMQNLCLYYMYPWLSFRDWHGPTIKQYATFIKFCSWWSTTLFSYGLIWSSKLLSLCCFWGT